MKSTEINHKPINPFADYTQFNHFTLDCLLKAWNRYIREGVDMIHDFLERIVPKLGAVCMKYEPYWEGNFMPTFEIKIPESMSIEKLEELWDKIDDMTIKFAKENDILPAFWRTLVGLTYYH